LAYLEENADENVTYRTLTFEHTVTHPILMDLTYLLTYLLFQFPVPVKYSL